MKNLIRFFSLILVAGFLASCESSVDSDNMLYLLEGNGISQTNSSSGSIEVPEEAEVDIDTTVSPTDYDSTGASAVDTTAYSKVVYLNLSAGSYSTDNSNFTEITVDSAKVFEDKTVKIKYTTTTDTDGNEVSTGLIKIDASSATTDVAFYISGTMSTGGIKIQSNATNLIGIYLNDATITSSDYPCIEITKGSAAKVNLSGTNTLSDGRVYGTGYGEEYSTTEGATYEDDGVTYECTVSQKVVSEGSDSKGTLYCKGDLTLTGEGSLKVIQAYKNCIASKAKLTVESGTYKLSSNGKNGLYADDTVTVNDGTISFSGTGVVSSSALRKTTGIKADSDNVDSAVYINGGKITIEAYNGKGIAGSYVYIAGGKTSINVTGTSGFTGDDKKTGSYYDADGVLVKCTGSASTSTDSSELYIKCAPEGIEGEYLVEISGGVTQVYAQDDGVNVSNDAGDFYMKDGYLYVSASKGDGIDANHNLYVQGGVIVSYAPTGSEDSFDSGNAIYITGGVIAGVSGSQMALSEYSVSGQKMLYFTGSSSGMGGMHGPGQSSSSSSFSKVAVYVSGECKYAFTLPTSSYGLFVMSAPSFTSSSSSGYTVYTSPSFSGGTDFNGLYAVDAAGTTMPSVTTGSATSSASVK